MTNKHRMGNLNKQLKGNKAVSKEKQTQDNIRHVIEEENVSIRHKNLLTTSCQNNPLKWDSCSTEYTISSCSQLAMLSHFSNLGTKFATKQLHLQSSFYF